jgi:hypothetical protein
MCLAIYKPANIKTDWDALEEGFHTNSHGAGFAYVDNGRLITCKGYFTFDEFRDAYLPVQDKQAAIHFRLATHGEHDANNCHPFLLSDDLAMVHNGVLDIACNVNKKMSDTWHYAELVLQPMASRDPDFFSRPEVSFMGGAAIRGSKFIFLRADGHFGIWNEESGHWAQDCWWSNNSYKPATWLRDSKPITGFRREAYVEETSESEYRDFLTGEAAWAYDDLLRHGYDVDDLDHVIRTEGQGALLEYAEDCTAALEGQL